MGGGGGGGGGKRKILRAYTFSFYNFSFIKVYKNKKALSVATVNQRKKYSKNLSFMFPGNFFKKKGGGGGGFKPT